MSIYDKINNLANTILNEKQNMQCYKQRDVIYVNTHINTKNATPYAVMGKIIHNQDVK